jgi:hypothetical protein
LGASGANVDDDPSGRVVRIGQMGDGLNQDGGHGLVGWRFLAADAARNRMI